MRAFFVIPIALCLHLLGSAAHAAPPAPARVRDYLDRAAQAEAAEDDLAAEQALAIAYALDPRMDTLYRLGQVFLRQKQMLEATLILSRIPDESGVTPGGPRADPAPPRPGRRRQPRPPRPPSEISPQPVSDFPARTRLYYGRDLSGVGNYDGAAAEFAVGYALKPMPRFLFNIAQCFRHLGRRPLAIRAYRRFLHDVLSPEGSSSDGPLSNWQDRALVDEASQHLRLLIAAQRGPELARRPWFWTLLGLSASAVIAGGVLWSLDSRPACSLQSPATQCPQLYSTAPAGITLTLGGAVLLSGMISFATAQRLRVAEETFP